MNINKTRTIQILFSEALYLSENTSCAECEYRTRLSGNLKKHIDLVHMGIKPERFVTPIFCDQCLSSESGGNFRKHIITVHGGKYQLEKKMKCDKCQYQARPFKVKTHVSVVHLGKSLKCSECDNKFKSTRSLEKHKCVNLCEKCDFKTNKPYLLRSHEIVTHLGFLVKCNLCENEYKSKHTLLKHMKIYHEGKKPQHKPCNICLNLVDERFMGRHLNAKHFDKFACEECNSSKICNLHFKCNQCKFIALKYSGLKFHKKRMHYL